MKRIAIVGAGGFAREVAWLISDINRVSRQFEFLGYVVADAARPAEHDSSDHILGDLNWLDGNRNVEALAFGIGNPERKSKVVAEVESSFPHLDWPILIHPTVQFDRDSCKIDRGVVLCAGSIGTVSLIFQEFCMVNLLCTIGHETRIGRFSVVNPTVNLSGGVTIGDRVLLGTGSQILQYINVGAGATVGAGAVVTKDVEPGTTVVGIPAKPLAKKWTALVVGCSSDEAIEAKGIALAKKWTALVVGCAVQEVGLINSAKAAGKTVHQKVYWNAFLYSQGEELV